MSLDIAEALLRVFVYNRKARKVEQWRRPIAEDLYLTSLDANESDVVTDEILDLASDMEVIFEVTENIKKITSSSLKYTLIEDTQYNQALDDDEERFKDICERNLVKEISRSSSPSEAIGYQIMQHKSLFPPSILGELKRGNSLRINF